jgi:hypothetical protein
MLRSHRHLSGTFCLGGLLLLSSATAFAAKSENQRTITRPGFDPTAARVELFQAMQDGQLETKIVAKNAEGGSVLIKNMTKEPITVDLPEAFVAVQINKQFGGDDGGGGEGGGGAQSTGGGFGGGGAVGGQGGGGDGFFSIPPERTVRVPYGSVCLNHGKPEPTPRTTMVMIPVHSYTSDSVLVELITMVGTGRLPLQAAQAAVWNRSDNMSWEQLAQKVIVRAGRKSPYFHPTQLQRAEILVATATGRARERSADDSAAKLETIPTRVGITN